MIAFLRGNIIYSDIEKSLVILDVQGVGYEILLPVNQMYFSQFFVQQNRNDSRHNSDDAHAGNSGLNHCASFFIYTYVREDRIVLYGFPNFTERELFSILLDTKDIGPKLAVTILSNIKADDFINLILTKNITGLSSIKGIGTLTAERIVSGLKNKIVKRFNSFKDVEAASMGSIASIAGGNCDRDGSSKNRNGDVSMGVIAGISNVNNSAGKKNNENNNGINDGLNYRLNHGLNGSSDDNLNNGLGSSLNSFKNPNNNSNSNDRVHNVQGNNNGNNAGKNIIYETALALNALGYSMADSIELASCTNKEMQDMQKKEQSQIADAGAGAVYICEINTENLLKECLKHIYKNKISL